MNFPRPRKALLLGAPTHNVNPLVPCYAVFTYKHASLVLIISWFATKYTMGKGHLKMSLH